MAVNLAKICADLSHPDPQIKSFALMSITRLSKQLVDAPAEIRELAARLKPLSSSDNPDVVFLARKAYNHIDAHFRDCLAESAPEPSAAPPPELAASPPVAVAPPAMAAPPRAPVPEPPAAVRPPEAPPARSQAATPPPATAAAPVAEPTPAAPPPAPPVSPPRDPSALGREELLALLPTSLPATYVASLLIQLASKGTAEDLEAVKPMLSHADDRVRANALEVFERLGNASHVPVLLPLLADRNNRARGNAVMALAKLGYPDLEAPLAEMLSTSAMSMRETAAFVLSRIDRPFVEKLLLQALADPYEGVRLRAVRALARFPTRPAVVGLKRTLNDLDINICEAAAESLRSIKALLQSQKAVLEAASLQSSAPVHAAASPAPAPEEAHPIAPPRAEPAVPAPAPAKSTAPGPETAPAHETAAAREELYRGLGTEIYQLCRLNVITHENLDSIFYEVLRYQDFLRNYMVKRGDPEDETRKSAIEHLQEKIRASFTLLGKQAAELLERRQLALPAKEGEPVRRMLAELSPTARS